MKKLMIVTTALLISIHVFAQKEMKAIEDTINKDEARLGLVTDVSFSKAPGTSVPNGSSGVGNLGINFEENLWYGSILFSVANTTSELVSSDTSSKAEFVNNLLIPERSGK